ncbi:uncharacterized protein V1513DRAFT_451842 [Lipomyces chichibuensis]|uniref:uncharacterized protein n=1 Tax=Lipomyces chichibuensis TaxID=1546026 RepID=UPI0033431769
MGCFFSDLRESIAKGEAQIANLERKLMALEVIGKPDQLIVDDESGLPMMEIREELDEGGNIIESSVKPQTTTGLEQFAEEKLNAIMKQFEPGPSTPSLGSISQTSPIGRNDRIEDISDLETQPPSVIVPSRASQEKILPQPKSILKTAKKDSDDPPVEELKEALSAKQSAASSLSESSLHIIDSIPTSTVPMPSQPTFTEQTQSSSSSLNPRRQVKPSGISSDLFEIERIAQEIDLQQEEDAEDILDLEITDGQLSWTLAGNDDDDDDHSESFDDDDNDDDEEDEDQYGRTRGTFFPYLPRGLDTPVLYGSLSPPATKDANGNVSECIRPTPTLEPQPTTFSETSLECEFPNGNTGSKQVRFSGKVAVQHFQSKLPSALVSTSSGLSSRSDHGKIASEELKPEHDDEPKPKKVSRFKLNRQNVSGVENAVQAMKQSRGSTEVHSDIFERQILDRRPVRPNSAKHQSSISSRAGSTNSTIEKDRPIPEPDKFNGNAPFDVIKEREPPPPIPSIKPGSRQRPPQPSRRAGNKSNPFIIGRPIPKNRSGNATSSQLSELVDIEALIRENISPNHAVPSHMQLEDELKAEVDEGSKLPLLSETIVERPFDQSTPSDGRKKQSLFKKGRTTNTDARPPSTTMQPQPVSTKIMPEHTTDDVEDDIDDDMTLDPEIHRQEIAVAYHHMRQKLIDKQGGYSLKVSEMDFVPLDENGEVAKISRFKNARLSGRARSN